MTTRPPLAALAAGCLLLSGLWAEDEPTHPVRTSRHLTDAILAGYRKDRPAPPPPAADAPTDVEPGLVVLPAMEVRGPRRPVELKPEDVVVKTEAIPLVAGTGVTEIKGPHRTILIRRILFIPVGFKLSW